MNNKEFLDFAKIVGKLKLIKRSGWLYRKIPNPESLADHSFRAALLGMVLSDYQKLDTEKIMRMLLIHDIEEAIIGDIMAVTKEKIDKELLREKQNKALKEIFSHLPENLKNKYISLWEEMEEGETKESKFCKDIDKLEMMIQVAEYENMDKDNKEKLDVFWEREDINVPQRIDEIVKIYEELRKQRDLK